MFDHVIRFSIRNKVIVVFGVGLLIAWGLYSLRQLPIDAVPDITNNQVQVVTISPSLAAEEIELLVTTPVEFTMASIPDIEEIRSISRFGLSVVTIVFHDDVDVYWARAQVSQRLVDVQGEISADAGAPSLAPVTTGLGEIYQYVLKVDPAFADRYSKADLRTIQDWTIKRRLLGTPGVADVSSFGGDLRQIEVAVDIERLRSFGLSIADIAQAVEHNNSNAGSAYIETGARVAYVRSEGRVGSKEDVGNILIRTSQSSAPIRLRDVASVSEGRAMRYGALTIDDVGEGVGGIVLMLKGANSSAVIEDVKTRTAEIQKSLPEGITIEAFLDRSHLVGKAINTVSTNLIEGALIVIFVLVLMLGNLRAGMIVASVIPLAMLFAIGMMVITGVSGNLMSLGALDFGLIVDAAVIIVEHVLHSLRHSPLGNSQQIVTEASIRMRRSASIGEFIILIVYVPILALTGIEGRMFIPMAQTVIYAIIGAFILSLTWVPMISALVLRKQSASKDTVADKLIRRLQEWYRPIRNGALRRPRLVLIISAAALVSSVFMFMALGGEFLPQLDEGDFAVEVRLPTGASVTETARVSMMAAEILLQKFPEVKRVIGKIGTAEIPLDPMPMSACDLMVILKEKSEWTSAFTREELASHMQEALEEIPGVEFGFQQPIQMRFNELMTGARQDVAVKIFGENLDTLAALGDRLRDLAEGINGATDLYLEEVEGLPQLVALVNRDACVRTGVSVDDVNMAVRSFIAGQPAGAIYEAERRFEIVIRMDTMLQRDESTFRRLPVPTADGGVVPLEQVAEISIRNGPNQVQHEDTRRRITVGFNVRGRDVRSIVDDLNATIEKNLPLPSGYYLTIGGQFENLATAERRLLIVVPLSLLIILVLLYMTFRSIPDTLIIFTAVPLATVGGIAALVIRGMPFSISAGVGFIALFGVAVLNGIVLLAAFKQAIDDGATNIYRVVLRGTAERLRPVLMTALVASLGFLPMALSTSDGAEVQRPLATVVIGGLVSSTLLTLLVLPVLYALIHRRPKRSFTLASRTGVTLIFVGAFTMCAFATSVCAQSDPNTNSTQASSSTPKTITRSEAVQQAIQYHPDVQQARSVLAEFEAVDGFAAVDIGRTSLTYTKGQYNTSAQDNNISIEQAIPFPTVWFAKTSLASDRIDMARAQLRLRERMVRVEVEKIFERVRFLRPLGDVLAEFDSLFSRAAIVSKTRERVGEGTRLASVSTESQRAEIVVKRKELEAELSSLYARLWAVVGTDVLPEAEILEVLNIAVDSTAELPAVTYSLAQAEVARAQNDVDHANIWPNFTVGWFTQTLVGTPTGDGRTTGLGDRFSGFMLGMQIPLWFPPDVGRAQQASIAERTAIERSYIERRSANIKRSSVRIELNAARSTLEYYQQTALAEGALLVSQSTRAWEAGEIGYLELQAALTRALTIRSAYLTALHRYNLLIIDYSLYTTP